jgi:hypothetical protein
MARDYPEPRNGREPSIRVTSGLYRTYRFLRVERKRARGEAENTALQHGTMIAVDSGPH